MGVVDAGVGASTGPDAATLPRDGGRQPLTMTRQASTPKTTSAK